MKFLKRVLELALLVAVNKNDRLELHSEVLELEESDLRELWLSLSLLIS